MLVGNSKDKSDNVGLSTKNIVERLAWEAKCLLWYLRESKDEFLKLVPERNRKTTRRTEVIIIVVHAKHLGVNLYSFRVMKQSAIQPVIFEGADVLQGRQVCKLEGLNMPKELEHPTVILLAGIKDVCVNGDVAVNAGN